MVKEDSSTESILKFIGSSDANGFFDLNVQVNDIGEDIIFIVDCCGGTINYQGDSGEMPNLFNGHFFKILRTLDALWQIDGYTIGLSNENCELYNIFITLATINSLTCNLLSICNQLVLSNGSVFTLTNNIKNIFNVETDESFN